MTAPATPLGWSDHRTRTVALNGWLAREEAVVTGAAPQRDPQLLGLPDRDTLLRALFQRWTTTVEGVLDHRLDEGVSTPADAVRDAFRRATLHRPLDARALVREAHDPVVADLTHRQHARIARCAGLPSAEVARAGDISALVALSGSPAAGDAAWLGSWPGGPPDPTLCRGWFNGAVRKLRPVAALAVGSALLLTGCGVEGTQFHPGVAAQVGDQTITSKTVDSLAAGYCTAVKKQIQQSAQSLPLRFLRFGIAGELVIKAAVDQLAEPYDAKPGTAYAQARSQAQTAAAKMSSQAGDAYIQISSMDAYIGDVLTNVGAAVLKQQGTASPTTDDEQHAGEKALSAWFRSHQIDIDPRYDFIIKDGQPTPTDTDISYPLGTLAKEGREDSPGQSYADALPSNLVCG